VSSGSPVAACAAQRVPPPDTQPVGVGVLYLDGERGTPHLLRFPARGLSRFTPFSQDAQPRIQGKCPLELAGYDIRQMPMAALCTGLSIMWPLEMSDVPNL
jgi:hypothetical protein